MITDVRGRSLRKLKMLLNSDYLPSRRYLRLHPG